MKKTAALILLLCMLIQLAACSTGGSDTPSPSPDQTSAVSRDPYEDFNNHFMANRTNGDKVCWAETEDYVFFGQKYYDKKTGDSGFYCSKPECMHTDSHCEAMDWVLGTYNGKIYSLGNEGHGYGRVNKQNIDRTEKVGLHIITEEEQGLYHFHRGKIYSFYHECTVDNANPRSEFRLTVIDPDNDESHTVFYSNEYYANAAGWLFILDNKVYLLLDYRAPEDAEEYPGKIVWELWAYNIDTDEMKLEVVDPDMFGRLRGSWITKEGEIYAMVGNQCLVKLTDGKFVKQLVVEGVEEMGGATQISDGVIITGICDYFEKEPKVLFRIQNFEGKIIAEDYLPFAYEDLLTEGWKVVQYNPVWADETCLWVQYWFEKPIFWKGVHTFRPMQLAVKYDIVDHSYSLVFAEPPGALLLGG